MRRSGGDAGPASGSARDRAIAVIPARIGSSRLPGKPLLVADGKSLIRHVIDAVKNAHEIDEIVVATDDARIAAEAHGAGIRAVMTDPLCATGSDRIGAALSVIEGGIILNVQGDEPEIEAALLDRLVVTLREDPRIPVATAAARWPAGADPADPNRVKVVCGREGRALYFSRAVIPHVRDGQKTPLFPFLHLGVYAYRREALLAFLALPRGRLEVVESLEQLRLIEHDIPITVVVTEDAPAGIDTPADLDAFRARLESRKPFSSGA